MNAFSQKPLYGRSRQRFRALKRLAREGIGADATLPLRQQSQEIALAFLDRSIKFKHRRLAILRLKEAVELGAAIEAAQWSYCWNVVTSAKDPTLHSTFLKVLILNLPLKSGVLRLVENTDKESRDDVKAGACAVHSGV